MRLNQIYRTRATNFSVCVSTHTFAHGDACCDATSIARSRGSILQLRSMPRLEHRISIGVFRGTLPETLVLIANRKMDCKPPSPTISMHAKILIDVSNLDLRSNRRGLTRCENTQLVES